MYEADITIALEKLHLQPGDLVVVKVRAPDLELRIIDRIRDKYKHILEGYGARCVIFGFSDDDGDVNHLVFSEEELRSLGRCPTCGVKGGCPPQCPSHSENAQEP